MLFVDSLSQHDQSSSPDSSDSGIQTDCVGYHHHHRHHVDIAQLSARRPRDRAPVETTGSGNNNNNNNQNNNSNNVSVVDENDNNTSDESWLIPSSLEEFWSNCSMTSSSFDHVIAQLPVSC